MTEHITPEQRATDTINSVRQHLPKRLNMAVLDAIATSIAKAEQAARAEQADSLRRLRRIERAAVAIRPHMEDKAAIGETAFERCCIALWKALDTAATETHHD